MSKNVVTLILLLLAVSANGYFLYERSTLKNEMNSLREREQQLKKEAEEDKGVWSTLYKDCVEERNALMAKLKDVSGTKPGSSSN